MSNLDTLPTINTAQLTKADRTRPIVEIVGLKIGKLECSTK